MLKRLTICCVAVFLLSGCAKLKHLNELLTLKGLADEQKSLDGYVEKKDNIFKELLAAVGDGTISQYPDKDSILKSFDLPIYDRKIEEGGQHLSEWMYRHPTEFFDSDKVYLYFNPQDKLIRWEVVPGVESKE